MIPCQRRRICSNLPFQSRFQSNTKELCNMIGVGWRNSGKTIHHATRSRIMPIQNYKGNGTSAQSIANHPVHPESHEGQEAEGKVRTLGRDETKTKSGSLQTGILSNKCVTLRACTAQDDRLRNL
jgi:hypothetical protein